MDIEAQVPAAARTPPVTLMSAVLPSVKVTVGHEVSPEPSRHPALEAAAKLMSKPAGLQPPDTEIPVAVQPSVTTNAPLQLGPRRLTILSNMASRTANRTVPDIGMLKVVELY
jgi:hypothetical protein